MLHFKIRPEEVWEIQCVSNQIHIVNCSFLFSFVNWNSYNLYYKECTVNTFHNMASNNETLRGESEISQKKGTEYTSIVDTPSITMVLLLWNEKMDGEPARS